jgi:tRNA/rRNA methyltransferase
MAELAEAFVIVLHQPHDVRNIGGVVRSMLNMGFGRLRLVQPPAFAASTIHGIAHRSEAILERMQTFTTLDAALADCRFVLGTSARSHPERTLRFDLRPLCSELAARATGGEQIALLFGPEDNGLDREALDRCHLLLRLPADPAYSSLNLAQAVLLLLYELRQALVVPPAPASGRRPALQADLAECVEVWREMLDAIGFLKHERGPATLRRLRIFLARAEPDARRNGAADCSGPRGVAPIGTLTVIESGALDAPTPGWIRKSKL